MEGLFILINMEEKFITALLNNRNNAKSYAPAKKKCYEFIEGIIELLFPEAQEKNTDSEHLKIVWEKLMLQFKELLKPLKPLLSSTEKDITEKYFQQIPSIHQLLLADIDAIHHFDPAAHSKEEIILSYPGFYAIMVYRLVHPLYRMSVPMLPRIISEHAHSKTGIDIHPGAQIGKSFFIDHGTGIVIGESTIIGNHVKLYQGVTLGALSVRKEDAKTKRHPSIEDHVIVYSGSTILGGETCIGHHSIIGGNVWLTKSLSPYSLVYNQSKIKIRNRNEKSMEKTM